MGSTLSDLLPYSGPSEYELRNMIHQHKNSIRLRMRKYRDKPKILRHYEIQLAKIDEQERFIDEMTELKQRNRLRDGLFLFLQNENYEFKEDSYLTEQEKDAILFESQLNKGDAKEQTPMYDEDDEEEEEDNGTGPAATALLLPLPPRRPPTRRCETPVVAEYTSL